MISMIFAISADLKIGHENRLLWNIPDDLKRFKQITDGKKLLMGRKTFESIPKLLPNRHHIILTRNKDYKLTDELLSQVDETTTYEIIHNLDDIIKYNQYENTEDGIIVIGGAEIYKKIVNKCSKIYATLIYRKYSHADTELDLDISGFKTVDESAIYKHKGKKYNTEYQYVTLERELS